MYRVLIVGLGTPGKKYENTRHNMGFMVLDRISQDLDFSFRKNNKAPRFDSAEIQLNKSRVIFLKPLDYMNRSGPSVSRASSFYKISLERLLVVHDDLDIELGRMKFVRAGGAGGHNGVRSIIEALGSMSFPRLKLGIDRPPPGIPAERYVLGQFEPDRQPLVDKVIKTASEAVLFFAKNGIDSAMNRFNGIVIA